MVTKESALRGRIALPVQDARLQEAREDAGGTPAVPFEKKRAAAFATALEFVEV
jgi:hypothetical protein